MTTATTTTTAAPPTTAPSPRPRPDEDGRPSDGRIRTSVWASDPVSRAGIVSQLRHRPELSMLAEDERSPCDVVLVVVDGADEAALQAVRAQRRTRASRVVLVAGTLDDHGLLAVVEAGACGVVRRAEATPERLVSSVRAAVAGDGTLPPDLLGRLLERVGTLQRSTLHPRGLTLTGFTQRELTVLRLLADGHSTSEVAKALAYSERTVKTAVQQLTSRLQLRNRTHAVAYALREGLI